MIKKTMPYYYKRSIPYVITLGSVGLDVLALGWCEQYFLSSMLVWFIASTLILRNRLLLGINSVAVFITLQSAELLSVQTLGLFALLLIALLILREYLYHVTWTRSVVATFCYIGIYVGLMVVSTDSLAGLLSISTFFQIFVNIIVLICYILFLS